MQKDISTDATEKLSNSLNELHGTSQTKSLMSLVKKQAEEIDRRGHIVMRMEESIKLQQENIEKLIQQNKHLESLIETLKSEREKMVEELKDLHLKTKSVSKTKRLTKQDEAA